MVDTRYLFPETYRFADQLTERLKLNLKVYRAHVSAAWQEARHGKLWEHGVEGIERYNQINKVEPMQRAIRELGVKGWITGLRRAAGEIARRTSACCRLQNGVVKIQPIIDWTDRMIYDYLKKHDLPYHPLWEQGYVSIGDVHTTRPLPADMTEEETRFFGLKRECGLHDGGAPTPGYLSGVAGAQSEPIRPVEPRRELVPHPRRSEWRPSFACWKFCSPKNGRRNRHDPLSQAWHAW